MIASFDVMDWCLVLLIAVGIGIVIHCKYRLSTFVPAVDPEGNSEKEGILTEIDKVNKGYYGGQTWTGVLLVLLGLWPLILSHRDQLPGWLTFVGYILLTAFLLIMFWNTHRINREGKRRF
ncbi:hypothetical protein [Paenibacillus jiagnxiensis]|uniref:hypothetical protein n=1 Tax=Paenibacillus jiagnxiensis TaxID=3228926 RepID=UPI0033B277A1